MTKDKIAKRLEGLSFSDCVTRFAENQSEEDAKYIAAAKRLHHNDGEIEVDDTTIVSGSDDDGDYVMAWVWVTNEDAGLPSIHEEAV